MNNVSRCYVYTMDANLVPLKILASFEAAELKQWLLPGQSSQTHFTGNSIALIKRCSWFNRQAHARLRRQFLQLGRVRAIGWMCTKHFLPNGIPSWSNISVAALSRTRRNKRKWLWRRGLGPNKEGGVGVWLLLRVWATDSLAISTTLSHIQNVWQYKNITKSFLMNRAVSNTDTSPDFNHWYRADFLLTC